MLSLDITNSSGGQNFDLIPDGTATSAQSRGEPWRLITSVTSSSSLMDLYQFPFFGSAD